MPIQSSLANGQRRDFTCTISPDGICGRDRLPLLPFFQHKNTRNFKSKSTTGLVSPYSTVSSFELAFQHCLSTAALLQSLHKPLRSGIWSTSEILGQDHHHSFAARRLLARGWQNHDGHFRPRDNGSADYQQFAAVGLRMPDQLDLRSGGVILTENAEYCPPYTQNKHHHCASHCGHFLGSNTGYGNCTLYTGWVFRNCIIVPASLGPNLHGRDPHCTFGYLYFFTPAPAVNASNSD
jgi:hypothetical protein